MKRNPLKRGLSVGLFLIVLLITVIIYLNFILPQNSLGEYQIAIRIFTGLLLVTVIFMVYNGLLLRKFNKELIKSKTDVEEREGRYRALFELTSEGLFDMNKDNEMRYYSSEWYRNIGVDISSKALEEWTRFIVEDDKDSFNNKIDDQMNNKKQFYVSEYKIVDKNGITHWIQASARAFFDKNGAFHSMSGVHRDITKLKMHEEEILQMAYVDQLTGLPNRLKFTLEIEEAIEEDNPFVILHLDLDSFKHINDHYGHIFGDQVIALMGSRLEKIVAKGDFVCHLNSDEFAILCRKYNTFKTAENYIHFLMNELSLPFSIGNVTTSLTTSIGACFYPLNGETSKDLLVNVDIALYEAKDSTRNSYKFYNDEIKSKALKKSIIENHLIRALELNEIYVNYQPVVDVAKKEIRGFEALARWYDEELGQVFPDIFIPLAEKTGFINPLGQYILNQSLIFAKELRETFGKYFYMNVNVSPVQLRNENYVVNLQETLVKHQFPAQFLNLEITESLSLEGNKKIISTLAEIRKMGIGISLDDFGTGYSSLNNLVSLSVSHIKIDKSLTQQATTLQEVHQLIRGVVEFAHAMDMKVVAEGVETKRMEEILDEMMVDYTQGYYYAKPLSKVDACTYIEKEENVVEELKDGGIVKVENSKVKNLEVVK